MSDFVHECLRGQLRFRLTAGGLLMVDNAATGAAGVFPWFKDAKTGKPWAVRKAKNFKALVAMADRDGDYDELKTKKGG